MDRLIVFVSEFRALKKPGDACTGLFAPLRQTFIENFEGQVPDCHKLWTGRPNAKQ
jgi:hypothetical protein